MNNAIFMYGLNDPDNAATVQIKIIEDGQREIDKSVSKLQLEVGNIEFEKQGDIYKAIITMDEDILEECCKRIAESINSIQEAYRQLVAMGIIEKKSRNTGPDFTNLMIPQ